MCKFQNISIDGYRRLKSVETQMRDFTVLIGANGVGKTSFLDVFSLLAASAKEELSSKIQEQGSLRSLLTRSQGESSSLKISLSMSVSNTSTPLEYDLELSPTRGPYYEITRERLTQQQDRDAVEPFKYIEAARLDVKYYDRDERKLLRPNWEHNPLETSLAQVPKMYQQPETLRKRLASCTYYGALDVSPTSLVRQPQDMRPAKLPGAEGENLVSCLYDLRETNPERFEIIEDTLAAAFPDFERLSFPPVAAGKLSLTWKDRNFSEPIYVHELSEGTLRFLWLVTLLQSQDLTAVTLVDEPEVSLHPELLQLLVHTMREASQRTQLIIATHSDRLIRFLEPEEVLICDMEDGLTTLTWGDDESLDMEKWLSEYSLDQIWSMNLIGGQP